MNLTFSEKRKRDEDMVNKIQLCFVIMLACLPVVILLVQAWHNFVTMAAQ